MMYNFSRKALSTTSKNFIAKNVYNTEKNIHTFTYLDLVSKITYLADASNATQATRTPTKHQYI